MAIVWSDTALVSFVASNGVQSFPTLMTIPPGTIGATVLFAWSYVDVTLTEDFALSQTFGARVRPVVGADSNDVGASGAGSTYGVLPFLDPQIAGEARQAAMFLPAATDLGNAQIQTAYTYSGSRGTITFGGVIAAAVDDRAMTLVQNRKTTSASNTGTIASELTIPGFPQFQGSAFFAFGSDLAASGPANTIDFSGGGSTWTNIVGIVSGRHWAAIGELPLANVAGATTPYNFTNMSARQYNGTSIAEFYGSASRRRSFASVVG